MSTMTKNDAGFTAEQRRQVQREINSRQVKIDKSVFVKTSSEKRELKQLKASYKAIENAKNY